MKRKKLFTLVLMLAFLLGAVGQSACASIYHAIDNDALESSGYWNVNYNNYYSYITGNSLWNGDARFRKSNGHQTYEYRHNSITLGHHPTAEIRAYLNHNDFSDPYAEYQIKTNYVESARIGYINQDRAAAGWNIAKDRNGNSKIVINQPGTTIAYGVRVLSSGWGSDYGTGADAVSVKYWKEGEVVS